MTHSVYFAELESAPDVFLISNLLGKVLHTPAIPSGFVSTNGNEKARADAPT
jgi:hypothetical protein